MAGRHAQRDYGVRARAARVPGHRPRHGNPSPGYSVSSVIARARGLWG